MSIQHLPYFLLLPLLLVALSAQSAGLRLKPFEASFEVSRNGISLGSMDLQLALDEKGGYRYTSNTRPEGFIALLIPDRVRETSEGLYDGERIVPHNYEYRQSDGKREKLTLLDFDWQRNRVWTESKGTRWWQEIAAGTHDKYSQQLALRLDLSQGKREVSYPVADGGRIKTYHFRVEGEEVIRVPQGRLKCLRVRRSKEDKPPDFTIWLASELGYLPVRLERKQSHGRYRMELQELKVND